MNATQGVILVMGSALALWLMWSAQSPFAGTGSGGGGATPGPNISGGLNPPGGSGYPPGSAAANCVAAGGTWTGSITQMCLPGLGSWGPTPGTAGGVGPLGPLGPGQRPAGVPISWVVGPSGSWTPPSGYS